MGSPRDDEIQLHDLLHRFSAAVERATARELAGLMCADEAESFLDNNTFPDHVVSQTVEVPAIRVQALRVFGDLAFARFTHESGKGGMLYFRREQGRWTVCADAGDELSINQLEGIDWPPVPTDATRLVRTVHELRRKPVASLAVEDLCVLLSQGNGLSVVLPRAIDRLWREPLLEGDLYPGDLLAAALRVDREYWRGDPVSLAWMWIIVDKVRALGDLTEHGAPHDHLWGLIGELVTELAD